MIETLRVFGHYEHPRDKVERRVRPKLTIDGRCSSSEQVSVGKKIRVPLLLEGATESTVIELFHSHPAFVEARIEDGALWLTGRRACESVLIRLFVSDTLMSWVDTDPHEDPSIEVSVRVIL